MEDLGGEISRYGVVILKEWAPGDHWQGHLYIATWREHGVDDDKQRYRWT